MAQPIGPTSLDLPSWVQAIGSILAILVAVWIGRTESLRDRLNREEEAKAELHRQIAERARFLHMVMLQLGEAMTVIDAISDEEQAFMNGEQLEEPHSWKFWAEQHGRRFQEGCVERLERLVALPLTAWPDIESGIVFGDAVREWEYNFKSIRENIFVPIILDTDQERDHYVGSLNDISYLSSFMPLTFERFAAIYKHSVRQASEAGIDLRYGDRNKPDYELQVIKQEQDHLKATKNPKVMFESELGRATTVRNVINGAKHQATNL